MTKNYTIKKINNEPKSPSEETLQFILNYSKSLQFIKLDKSKEQAEINLN
jgi:hypothetical protein